MPQAVRVFVFDRTLVPSPGQRMIKAADELFPHYGKNSRARALRRGLVRRLVDTWRSRCSGDGQQVSRNGRIDERAVPHLGSIGIRLKIVFNLHKRAPEISTTFDLGSIAPMHSCMHYFN